ncbi:unnamed protein product [Paramecium sonneborni]|uniref:Protein OS9-like domain-containing protein n=1 Tax=Paramecium sonneborni TaxID=65129 RepID=A0A8S1LST6_9CILI|nr:unnamed protein product [Paramecium sonneborni]
MLIFLIFTFAQAFNADNAYSIYTIEKNLQDKHQSYPELYSIQHILDSIQKQITLQDGRKVLCQIPIPQISQLIKIDALSITTNLTDDQANSILFPLIGQCVHHQTKEFLYEYCYRKYVRQYDDLNTMLSMQKILKEDFSLGYSHQFTTQNYSYTLFEPYNSSYHLDTNYHQILQQIDRLIIIEGCLAKLRNNDQFISEKYEYQLNVSTTHTVYTFRVIQVIYNELLLLSQCSDILIISDYFELIQIKQNKVSIKQNQYYQYKNVIFALNLQAQEMFYPKQSLGVIFTEKVFFIHVKKVIDYCAIQVLGFQQHIKYQKSISQIKHLILMDANTYYEELEAPILILENILFIQQLINQININDYIVIYDTTTSVQSYIETFRITQFHNGIAILDKQLTKGLRYEGKAIIKRINKFVKQINFTQPLLDTYEYQNDDLISLTKLEYEYVQIHIFNHSNQGYQLKQQYQKYMGITFSLYQLNYDISSSLFLNIISEMYLTTQIALLTSPQSNIYIKTQDGNYTQMESRFKNNSLLNQSYWIIIDTLIDKLYVGMGDQIKLANKLIEFQLLRKQNKSSQIIFEFDKKSNGLKLYDIMFLPLSNFGLFRTTISTEYFHALNFTGGINGVFEETYQLGSFCNPINSTRQSQIKFTCHPGDLMRFMSITEEEICKYQITIGTYLLCDKKQDIVEPTEHPILCILKQ